MIKAIIVDDYKLLRGALGKLLTKYCPSVHVVAEAESVADAFGKINQFQPDLVFIDIELGERTGFDLLTQFEHIGFKTIFITAHDEYAIQAVKFRAFDYLLKPVDKDELVVAVRTVEKAIDEERMKGGLSNLVSRIDAMEEKPKKIVIRTYDRIDSLDINNIIRCESLSNYTCFYFNEGKKLVASVTLKKYEDLLVSRGFFRTHQSHLINMSFFGHFLKTKGGIVVMKDGSQVPLSVRKKEVFLKRIEYL